MSSDDIVSAAFEDLTASNTFNALWEFPNVLTQDIRGISTQILELNQILDETKTELANLKEETSTFGSSLSDASSNLDESVVLISNSVGNIEEGSSQLNALLFPVVASIAIILALQIVIIARRR